MPEVRIGTVRRVGYPLHIAPAARHSLYHSDATPSVSRRADSGSGCLSLASSSLARRPSLGPDAAHPSQFSKFEIRHVAAGVTRVMAPRVMARCDSGLNALAS